MKYDNQKVSDLIVAYIGGGSKGWAWNLMSDLALESGLSGTVRLYDIDAEASRLNALIGNGLAQRPEAVGKWRYETAASLEEALTGADFVIMSILPATFKEMQSDVHAPEAYGIFQSVGDTAGPGGLMRALRTLPMYVEIAQAIKQYAPLAWVVNYTNPMTLCTRILYEIFPGIKAFGCCHEVFGTQKLLAAMLEDQCGIAGVPHSEIKTNVLGINHFTWIDRASWQGMDLIPLYREFVKKYHAEGFALPREENWMNSYFSSMHRVKFDLFLRYGIIAAAGDRHLAEFTPERYLRNPETVASWKFSLTPVSWRVSRKKELEEQARRLAGGLEQPVIKSSGEEGLRQIKALLGLGDFVTNVNIPNLGQAPDIPIGAVVETNALFSRDSIQPVIAGSLPEPVRNMVLRHVINQETLLKASQTKDKDLAFSAFLNDPMVTIGTDEARKLFDTMLAAIKDYLPGWNP